MKTEDISPNAAVSVAPSGYLGDWSALDGGVGVVRMSGKLFDPMDPSPDNGGFVKISGACGVATYSFPVPANPYEWYEVEVPIDEAVWTLGSGTWSSLLRRVTSFRVHTEFIDGDVEIVGWDNIYVGPSSGP